MGSLKTIFRRSGQGKDRRRVLSASTPSADASTAPHDGAGGGDLLSRPSGTSPSPSSSSAAELERVFRKFDKNGDGRISESELAAVFASLGGQPTPEELERMMKEADSNGDGFISLEEFKDLNTSLSGPEDELRDLQEAFAVFDLRRRQRMTLRPALPRLLVIPLLLFLIRILTPISEAKMRVTIPDELSDVVEDEEDEAWKEWGRKKRSEDPGFPPYDPEQMSLGEFQAEMLKRHVGPAFGFVKLRLGVRRTPNDVTEIASRWSKILRTGSIEVTFLAVDTSTVMFNLQKGHKTIELKEFLLGQPEAYEVKIGDQLYRRPGDPPLDKVIERLRRERGEESKPASQNSDHSRDELFSV